MEHQPSGESSGNGSEGGENEELSMEQGAYLAVLRALRTRSIHVYLGQDEPKIFPQLREFLGICDRDHTRLSMMLITEEAIGDAGESNPDAHQPAHDAPGPSHLSHPAAQGCTPSRQQPFTDGQIRSLEQDAYDGLVRAYNFMAKRQTNIDWDKQLDIFDELRELLRIRNDNCSQAREAGGGSNPAQATPADAPSAAAPHHPAAQTIDASSGPASADSPGDQPLRPRFRSLIELTYGSQYEMEQLALQQNHLPIPRRDEEGAADEGHDAEAADDDEEENASDQSDDPEWRPEDEN